MGTYPVPANEAQRLEALRRYADLGALSADSYDDFTRLASYICGTPMALIGVVDESRQWFQSTFGCDFIETPREQAICTYALLQPTVLEVPDTQQDERFAANPAVTGDPNVRFYAGAPLIDSAGHALGTLCVMDRVPRRLTSEQTAALEALARQVMAQFEYRRISAELADALDNVRTLRGLLPMCSYCKQIRNDKGYWNSVEHYISSHSDASLSHGICPTCLRQHYPDIADEMLAEQ